MATFQRHLRLAPNNEQNREGGSAAAEQSELHMIGGERDKGSLLKGGQAREGSWGIAASSMQ